MITPKILIVLFAVTFSAVQATKIIAALVGLKLLSALVFFPLLPYSISLIQNKDYKQIKLHSGILFAQVLLALLHYFFLDLQLNSYTFFFFLTPHYFLSFKNCLHKYSSTILDHSLAIAIIVTFLLASISIAYSPGFISQNTLQAMAKNFFSRNANLERVTLLSKMNFGQHLFGVHELTLEAVAMTVFPIVFIAIAFVRNWKLSVLSKVALIASMLFLLMKNSRGELLFVAILFAYPVVKIIMKKIPFLSFGFIALGFIQLLIQGKALNGRRPLNELFLENITVFGKGIGFSSAEIQRITAFNYSSFHNAHFEIITNFGLLIYLGMLAALYFYILKGSYNKARHLILSTYLVLLATNFEVFDFYFCVPVALALTTKDEGNSTSSQP
ncbi:MAG: hypothetical protein V4598_17340 [Bdellovibrionota bacterium]